MGETQLIKALNAYMNSNQKLQNICKTVGSTGIWELFWKIAGQNKTLYDNLYKNLGNFYDTSIGEFNFKCEEKVYKAANYEMYLKQVLRYIDPVIYTTKELGNKDWKASKSLNIIKEMLICLFDGKGMPIAPLYAASRSRNNDQHEGLGNNNIIIQQALVGMYIATCVAKKAKDEKIVAGVIFEFEKCRVSGTIPPGAKTNFVSNKKKIRLPESLFTAQDTIFVPIEIYKGNKIVFRENMEIHRGDFRTIKPKKHLSIQDIPAASEQTLKKVESDAPKKEPIHTQWFIRYKKQIMQVAFLLLSSVVTMVTIRLVVPQMQTEDLQMDNFYPQIDGAWVIKSLHDSKTVGSAQITPTNEYGTQGRIFTSIYNLGEQTFVYTLNRNTGELNIDGNIRTQVENVNSIVKLKFIFGQWELEKY